MSRQPLDLHRVRRVLADHEPATEPVEVEPPRRAAVAVILRERPRDLELMLIRRAEREGDPWSGHMAFPGGHLDPTDADLQAAARRETLEEVGFELPSDAYVGALDEYPARARGRFTGMIVSPFVFAVSGEPNLTPNHEVAEVVWAPVSPMMRGELDTTRRWQRDGESFNLPGYAVGPHVVWGMTYGMLQLLFDHLAPPQRR